ncbi:hypothetical protein ATO6_21710 [Oceanicola sp. 22II-s10i]|uniref:NAD(P)H-hydrate dehydratase n=1 Tax=Oceanicola sp. 22II-s10i TaxID=1317116 RepID=UPI000B521CFC|nr:NAD(P)H-hydrate dehydratase [Oceanicola sp. 22II-s10i]OWU82916.1 hypothetical protein ATO6_21710 [Oceanicola sp. 22II-s10i]
MTELLTSGQMRGLEQAAIASGETTGLRMMERAGRGVVDAVLGRWPDLDRHRARALVLCGPGNNGGDGYVIARVLEGRGWTVDVLHWGDPARLPPDAAAMRVAWGGDSRGAEGIEVSVLVRPDLIVDALFGTGLTRPLPEALAAMLDELSGVSWPDGGKPRCVAVDCPSGLNLDTGFPAGPCVPLPADLTVTFHAPKLGHYLGEGPSLCGALDVVPIGLDAGEPAPVDRAPPPGRVRLVGAASQADWPALLMARNRGGGHKFDHGSVAVFAGGVGRGGAARLAARAALRAGAGLVTVICPKAALIENAARLDAVMLRGLDDPAGLDAAADDRTTGFVIGPGLGVTERTRALVHAVLERGGPNGAARRPVVVLDADALTAFQDDPDALFARLHDRCILTPHEGEFGRLFPDLALSRRAGSKVDAVRAAAARAGCLVLLKGEDTVIAGPDGGVAVHAAAYGRAVRWLGTAGAGDVLAGMICGLAAPPGAAELAVMAEAAVWLHVECARAFGPGLIAEDLPERLPVVLSRLSGMCGAS